MSKEYDIDKFIRSVEALEITPRLGPKGGGVRIKKIPRGKRKYSEEHMQNKVRQMQRAKAGGSWRK